MNLFSLKAFLKLDSSSYEKGIGKARGGIGELSAWTVAKGQVIAGAITQGAKALAGFGKAAVSGYAEAEQLVGGIETLFGAGGKSIEEYAAGVGKTVDGVKDEYDKLMRSQKAVMDHAKNAYQTAGMSANEYMETVTGFSASLLQSMGGDTEKAAETADRALTDMSDNANKMGTSMESIKFAYSGFAKGNYTMLDNLKLGYGGTQKEMQRLLKDAEKLSGQKFDISSYEDVINAIHIMQEEMGIAGTTQKEAASTISGSLGMVKGAWENLVSGLADPKANIGVLVSNMVESVGVAAKNLIPAIGQAAKGFGQAISEIGSILTEDYTVDYFIQGAFDLGLKTLDGLQASVDSSGGGVIFTILESLALWVEEYADVFAEKSVHLIESFTSKAAEAFPKLLDLGVKTVSLLASGIAKAAPGLASSALRIVSAFLHFIDSNAAGILRKGVEMIGELGFGIYAGLPKYIEKLPAIITGFTGFIARSLPIIAREGGKLIGKLTVGIIGAVPQMIAQLPKVLDAITTAIADGYRGMLEAGGWLIVGIWEGIRDKIGWLKSKVSGVIEKIKGWFTGKKGFDTHSPSRWFRKVTHNVIDGGPLGIDDGMPAFMRSVDKNVSRIKAHMDPGAVSIPYSQTAMGRQTIALADAMAAAPSVGGVYHIHVDVDSREMAETIFDPLQGVVAQRGVSFA